jgi:hypothetical protein
MAKHKWTMDTPDTVDKSFFIHGPEISLEVDYDDVDHPRVLREAKRIVKLLNVADKPKPRKCAPKFKEVKTCLGCGKPDPCPRDCPAGIRISRVPIE